MEFLFLNILNNIKGRIMMAKYDDKRIITTDFFIQKIHHLYRTKGTAVFLTANPLGIPPSVIHFVKHTHSLPQRVFFSIIII